MIFLQGGNKINEIGVVDIGGGNLYNLIKYIKGLSKFMFS